MKFPEEFIKRIETQDYIDSRSLLSALEMPSPVSIRINRLKWKRIPESSEQVPWCNFGYYLESRPSYTLDPLYHAGCYYPQEASGMFIGHVAEQFVGKQAKVRVLDLCGAPGGKSTHLSSILGPGSFLVSNEVIRSRASVLEENVNRWGISNTIVTCNDPSDFAKFPGFFDLIVIDAPCSGEGMFRDPVAVNEWSPENARLCSDRQKRILMDAWPALKENGILIYSTCTFNPDENERNMDWFYCKANFECLPIDISGFKGITEVKYNGITGYGFYPGRIRGEGFFVSVLKKREEVVSNARSYLPITNGVRNKLQYTYKSPLGDLVVMDKKRHLKQIYITLKDDISHRKDDYLLAEKMINITGNYIARSDDWVVRLPCEIGEFQILRQNLRIIKPGTRLFKIKNRDYFPSHELALSCELKKEAFPLYELDYEQVSAYLRREPFKGDLPEKGWLIVTWMGVNLGFAKNLGNRINNYFPVSLRVRKTMGKDDQDSLIRWLY